MWELISESRYELLTCLENIVYITTSLHHLSSQWDIRLAFCSFPLPQEKYDNNLKSDKYSPAEPCQKVQQRPRLYRRRDSIE